jgi:uncharacterized membrane protein
VIAVVVVALNIVTNFVSWVWQDSTVMQFVISLASAFISLVIGLGLIRAALIILDGRSPEVSDLLSTKDLVPYILASLLTGVIVVFGLVLCIIPGLIAGFLLQFFGYAIVDRRSDTGTGAPSSDPIGAMRTSYEIASKNVGNLLVLALLCLVLNLVGALLCGLGLIVSLPVTAIAIAYAWRHFTGGIIAPQL